MIDTDTDIKTPDAATFTRDRILDAARDLILHRHPAALTVQQIADTAGVSHRTIYRYFPTKDELIHAVAERPTDAVLGLAMPTRWDEVRGALRMYWQFFGENMDMVRSERMVPGGLDLRRARLERARPAFDAILADAGVVRGPTREALMEILAHLTSSTTLLELVDRHGLTVEAATDLVLDALDRLVYSAVDRDQRHKGRNDD